MTAPKIAPSAVVHPRAIVRGNVVIGDGSIIFPGAVIQAKEPQTIRIGHNVLVEENCILEPAGSMDIEKNVTIGHGAIILGRFVGKNSLIGINAIVGPGVTTGESCIVSSGCIVNPDTVIPDRTIVSGVPSKIKGRITGPALIWVSDNQDKRALLYKLITDTFQQRPEAKNQASAQVDPSACIIGDVSIGNGSVIGSGAVLRGDFGPIRIGENCTIEEHCILHSGDPHDQVKGKLSPLEIGNSVFLGAGSVVHGREVGDRVKIGPNGSILHGGCIGPGSQVAPLSVVKSSAKIPEKSFVSGSPGQITALDEDAGADTLGQKTADTHGYLTHDYPAAPMLKGPVSIHSSVQVFGEVEIGKGSVIHPGVILNGSLTPLRIGENTIIGTHSILGARMNPTAARDGLTIGSNVNIGPGAVIRGVRIGSDSIVGAKAVISTGIELSERSTIAQGCLIESTP